MLDWLVVEDISGAEPRYEAMPYDPEDEKILRSVSNVGLIWTITDLTAESAVAFVLAQLEKQNGDPEIADVKIDTAAMMMVDQFKARRWRGVWEGRQA